MTPSKIMSEAGRRVNVTRPLTHPLDCGEEGLAVNATQRTCSIDGCDRAHIARGLCTHHYNRATADGTIGRYSRRTRKICCVDDCVRPSNRRGYCYKHGARVLAFGTVELPPPPPKPVCSVASCNTTSETRGLCVAHYARFIRYGHAEPLPPSPEIEYRQAHCRVANVRGHARHHTCVDCSGSASEWSYRGDSPEERISAQHRMRFSPNPDDYDPRCVPCHRIHDARMRAQ